MGVNGSVTAPAAIIFDDDDNVNVESEVDEACDAGEPMPATRGDRTLRVGK